MNKRLGIFLTVAFGLTWCAWGLLIGLVQKNTVTHDQWPFMTLFVLGGLGPTIAAYVSILATPDRGPVREYHARLLRWRVSGWWYLIAIGLPIALAMASVTIALLLKPDLSAALSIDPWYRFFALFGMMIVGGGLEELGWRGVAQEELQRSVGPAKAALLIGLVWAAWHVPLFFLPGVAQYGGNFGLFAINVIGMALMLGWLYSRTSSILLCIALHACANALASLGVTVPHEGGGLALLGPCLGVLAGVVLLATAKSKLVAAPA